LALDIYGTGPCENDVRQLIRERGNIKLIGYVTELELMKALKRSRKFVFASTWSEGMPITFIQALAAGAAVISTRLNSVGDEVVFNKLGKTVMIPIKLGTLAASLEVNEILKFGDNARALYESTYTPEIWSNKILNVYESLKH
jgi:glycosyltransferase involved in cell wall biosynthesis